MTYSLNQSMTATQIERQTNKWTALTRIITILVLSQIVLGALNAFLTLIFMGQVDPNQMVEADLFSADAYFALYGSVIGILMVIILSRYVESRSWRSLGLTQQTTSINYLKCVALTLAILCGLSIVQLLDSKVQVSFNSSTDLASLLVLLVGILLYTAFQEISLRGYLMNALSVDGKVGQAIGVTACLQAVLYLFNDQFSFNGMINIFLISVLLSYVFYLTDDLCFSWLINALSYLFFGLILGSQYQGQLLPSSIMLSSHTNGQAVSLDQSLVTMVVLILIVVRLHFKAMDKVNTNDSKK